MDGSGFGKKNIGVFPGAYASPKADPPLDATTLVSAPNNRRETKPSSRPAKNTAGKTPKRRRY